MMILDDKYFQSDSLSNDLANRRLKVIDAEIIIFKIEIFIVESFLNKSFKLYI